MCEIHEILKYVDRGQLLIASIQRPTGKKSHYVFISKKVVEKYGTRFFNLRWLNGRTIRYIPTKEPGRYRAVRFGNGYIIRLPIQVPLKKTIVMVGEDGFTVYLN